MAETTSRRSQVTITLGRSGQVVKRAGPVSDEFIEPKSAIGSKRPLRDRLSTNSDVLQVVNKRQRGDSNGLSLKSSSGSDGIKLGKDDLRFKILKRTQSNGQHKVTDLREILSRPSQSTTSNVTTHQQISEPRRDRDRVPDLRDRERLRELNVGRPRMAEQKDGRQRMPEPREFISHISEPGNVRQPIMAEPREVRRQMPDLRDVRRHMPELREVRPRITESSEVRQHIPDLANGTRNSSSQGSESRSQLDSLRNSYSSWTLEHIRRASPDRSLNASRVRSPLRSVDETQRRPITGPYDDLRIAPYSGRDVELPRPVPAVSYMAKADQSSGPVRSASSLGATRLPPTGVVPRSTFTVDEQPTIEGFLHSLGLEKYTILFNSEEVDMAALRQMGDNDLKEMGIPMGPRKKILLALLSRSRRPVQLIQ